jgi:hypothetical protein
MLSMSGMGVNQNLDPVEAAMLLRDDPRRILTMIMFGLMKKGNVRLLSTEPLRLQLVARKDLNYYEALFADAIKGDTLNEDRLLACFKMLAQRVVDKTRPYSRKETEAFYRKKIDDAWKDVQAVDTPELKIQKYDTNMFWLMADEQFAEKTPDALRSPGWNTATAAILLVVPVLLRLPAWNDNAVAGTADHARDRSAHEPDHFKRGIVR